MTTNCKWCGKPVESGTYVFWSLIHSGCEKPFVDKMSKDTGYYYEIAKKYWHPAIACSSAD